MQRITFFIQKNRIFRFVISGGLAVLANLSFLFLLTECFRVHYLYSAMVSFSIGFFVTFFLQKFWTFREKDKSKIAKQMTLTFAVAAINLLLNTFLIFVFVEMMHVWYMAAQALASILLSLETYFLYKNIIFRR
ncbi:MAG: GtrA family protein [Candidatus Paceibacterota bacterium]|jgi:putative flippase GtrA